MRYQFQEDLQKILLGEFFGKAATKIKRAVIRQAKKNTERDLAITAKQRGQEYKTPSQVRESFKQILGEKKGPCWKNYEMVGWKMKGGKKVPNCVPVKESEEKQNKPLNKPFRTPGGPKKFSVYVKNDKGNVVKVNFGDPNMEIKRDDPKRLKSFRARHNCENPGPKWKARYWSCYQWRSGAKVEG